MGVRAWRLGSRDGLRGRVQDIRKAAMSFSSSLQSYLAKVKTEETKQGFASSFHRYLDRSRSEPLHNNEDGAETMEVDWVDPVTGEEVKTEPAPYRDPIPECSTDDRGDLFASSDDDDDADVIQLDQDPPLTEKKKKRQKQRIDATLDCHPSYLNAQQALDQFNLCSQSAAIVTTPATASGAAAAASGSTADAVPSELKEKPLDLFAESIYKTIVLVKTTMLAQQKKASKSAKTLSVTAPLTTQGDSETHPAQWASSLERWSYTHMDRLFVAAGPRRSTVDAHLTIHSPPCLRGDECRAKSLFGFTLMASMTVEDLKAHETTGLTPAQRLPCVLCGLFIISSLQTYADCGDLTMPSGVIGQWFYNPIDEPDGYEESACYKPHTGTSIVIAPVLRYSTKCFACAYVKANVYSSCG